MGDHTYPKGFTLEKSHADQCNTARKHPDLFFRTLAPTFSQSTSWRKSSNPRNSSPKPKSPLSLPKSNVAEQLLPRGLSRCPVNFKDNLNLRYHIGVDHDHHLLNWILPAKDPGKEYIGFSVAKVQCPVAQSWAAAIVIMFIQSIYSDKWHVHGSSFLTGMLWVSLLGLESWDILSIRHRSTLRTSQLLLLCVSIMT